MRPRVGMLNILVFALRWYFKGSFISSFYLYVYLSSAAMDDLMDSSTADDDDLDIKQEAKKELGTDESTQSDPAPRSDP